MSIQSNWCRCTSCHAGYGWKDNKFDFSRQENVDCLVCHDTTGTYKKFPAGCGHPAYEEKKFGQKIFKPVDLKKVAQNVGRTSRKTCGACHFYGGGGNGVKHGDLDSSLVNPEKSLDVHMDYKGLNFSCTTCHTTFSHQISGRCYSMPAPGKHQLALPRDDGNRLMCESCHGNSPHKAKTTLNQHTNKVACVTCHIPALARVKPTKLWWDWSKAGQFTEDGKIIIKKDKDGNVIYHTKKGEMKWAKNLVPEYLWFNGIITYVKMGDKIDDTEPVILTKVHGNPQDPESKIYPFKLFKGKQPYDPIYKTLVVPKLFGKKGTGAYWAQFDWVESAKAGMATAGLPFSGRISFIETWYYRPVAHMIPPKEGALGCQECHSQNGRLKKLTGFYMPGRDKNAVLDITGWTVASLTFMGVIIHGLLRINAWIRTRG